MNIITGYKGEPHITAQEDRDINVGVVGNSLNDVYVLNVGQMLEAEIVTANEIRIRDGVLIMQGCAASIDYGAYDSLEISNGALGMQRIDIIAAQYEKDNDTSVESVSLVVVEGTPDAADPQPPTLTGGDLQGGDTFIQMPLYYVNINGVSIDSVVAQFVLCNYSISDISKSTTHLLPETMTTWATKIGNTGTINNIIKYLASTGTIVSKAWKVNTSTSSGTACTDDITLTPGVWMLGVITPTCSADAIYYFSNISSTLTYPYFSMGTGGSGWIPVSIATTTTTHVTTGSSATVNFSNTTRGRIFAIRIG